MFKVIKTLTETCSACPTQYEGQLTNGDYVYIRYRHGIFTIGEGKSKEDKMLFKPIYRHEIGDNLDGYMTLDEVLLELNRAGYNVKTRQSPL